MKTKGLKSTVCLFMAAITMSSCVGSFALFNKPARWNKHATNSKFLNEIIFIAISPAYVFCGAADCWWLTLLNSGQERTLLPTVWAKLRILRVTMD